MRAGPPSRVDRLESWGEAADRAAAVPANRGLYRRAGSPSQCASSMVIKGTKGLAMRAELSKQPLGEHQLVAE